MHVTSLRSLTCVFLFHLFCNIASARHIDQHHRLHRHHHAVRDASPEHPEHPPEYDVSFPSECPPSPSETEDEKAVILDVDEMQKGLRRLPEDLMEFLNAVEQRLEGLERIVSALLTGSTETAVPIESIPPGESLTDIMPLPAPSSAAPTSTPRLSLCLPPGGAGPLIPCPPRRRKRPVTSTAFQTVTTRVFHPRVSRTGIPYGTRTAPWFYPAPYQPGGGTLMTGSVQYAPPMSTVNVSTVVGSLTTSYTSPPSTMYTFDANAPDNVAVYYGQTPNTQQGGLLALCQDVNVDIAILAFVYDFFSPNNYPSYQFGPNCTSTNPTQTTDDVGLTYCEGLASEITACQRIGKTVLISLGGAIANSSFSSDAEAQQFAATLWNMFGAGTDTPSLRPFGTDVVVDGFDIDNENHNTSYYQTFATALRQTFALDNTKTYYLSAAPQCPMPDASIPMGAMLEADFVWVQFYNNPECNLGSAGFQASFAAWSGNLSAEGTGPGKPRVFVGAAAARGAAGSGYVVGTALSDDVSLVRELDVPNLGGIMLWDGSEAMANVAQYGVNYLQYAKSALDL